MYGKGAVVPEQEASGFWMESLGWDEKTGETGSSGKEFSETSERNGMIWSKGNWILSCSRIVLCWDTLSEQAAAGAQEAGGCML